MSLMISESTRQAIIAHAMRDYPRESCGLIVDGAYVPCFNYATCPERDFKIASEVLVAQKGTIEAIVHSHPDGPLYPSENDMKSQVASALPWVIVPCFGGETCLPFTMWGDSLPIAPMIGRQFMHGVTDCYAIIRDSFRLGKEALAAQGVTGWPFDPITLPEVPRDDSWWAPEDGASPKDLYADGVKNFGFREIGLHEARPGDVFLCKVKSKVLNHGGVLIGNNLLLHHLPARLSRREPAGLWARAADLWVRYEGPGA